MTNQKQTKLGAQNSILSAARVRRLSPEQLGISAPGQQSDQIDESDQGEELRSAAVDATDDNKEATGAAVLASDETLHTGILVEGDGWATHAVELAISKAISDGAEEITGVAIYSEYDTFDLCGCCIQAIADYRSEDLTVQLVSDNNVCEFEFEELYPMPWK